MNKDNPISMNLTFHKTLSSNIKHIPPVSNEQIHFTEKGEIFMTDKSGELKPFGMGNDNAIKESLTRVITGLGIEATGEESIIELISLIDYPKTPDFIEYDIPQQNIFNYARGARVTYVTKTYGVNTSEYRTYNNGCIATSDSSKFYELRKSWGVQDGLDCNDSTNVVTDSSGTAKTSQSSTTQTGKGQWHTIIIDPTKFNKNFDSSYQFYIPKLILSCPNSDGDVTLARIYTFTGNKALAQYTPNHKDWALVHNVGTPLLITPSYNTFNIDRWVSLIKLDVYTSNKNYTELSAIKAICSKARKLYN